VHRHAWLLDRAVCGLLLMASVSCSGQTISQCLCPAPVCTLFRCVIYGLLPEDEAADWVRSNKGKGAAAASTPVKAAAKRPGEPNSTSTDGWLCRGSRSVPWLLHLLAAALNMPFTHIHDKLCTPAVCIPIAESSRQHA
jgi:hypothetical protein